MTDALDRSIAAPVGTPARDTTVRGDRTRDRLLDAAEAMVAAAGYDLPSHRTLAARAGVHVALIHYHFGSKDALYDAALARRAPLAARAWREALDAACAGAPPDAGAVFHAWWRPFAEALDDRGAIGRDYLCMVARLADRPAGESLRTRYFGDIEDRYLRTLRRGIAGARPPDLAAGWCYATRLMNDVLLRRCGYPGGPCGRTDDGGDELEGLLAWLASGMQSCARGARVVPADAT